MRRLILLLTILLLPAELWAARYAAGKGSEINFVAVHPTHRVVGTSTQVRGELDYAPSRPLDFSGVVGKPIQAAWVSFESGNANRDANMRSAVGAQSYPDITFVPTAVTETTQAGPALKGKLLGRLYINGVRREIAAPVEIDATNPQLLRVRSKFTIRMTDYNIEPPSLLFVKTDDDVEITVDLHFVPKS